MIETYDELKHALTEFSAETRSASDLKHLLAPYGIYQQKNGLFMLRIRVTGGILSVEKFEKISRLIQKLDGYAHLSTRQTIQIHDVAPDQIYPAILECAEMGLPFRGGGGNTFRNIMISPLNGLHSESLFDLYPYAEALKSTIFLWDNAFSLPRKLKIGLFDPADSDLAKVQDLGFLAEKQNGICGFRVFGGGGLGRESGVGIELIDFIPANLINRAARAMTDLFFDHGDRANRSKARVRFLLRQLGDAAFQDLFLDYFDRTDLPPLVPSIDSSYASEVKIPSGFENDDFNRWKKRALVAEHSGKKTIRLFVPKGRLTSEQCLKLCELFNVLGLKTIRLTPEQDILLPQLEDSALPYLYQTLATEFSDVDLTLTSFCGHIVTCIGSTVCKIGILDSVSLGERIAKKLDQFFEDKANLKDEYAVRILNSIRISGCPSSCSSHPAATVGFHGLMRKINDQLSPYWQGFVRNGDEILAVPDESLTSDVDAADLAIARVLSRLGIAD